ncbi:L-arabinose isomerase [Cyclobacterium plantarum]|uniref:L-arabinose isomerase n=1 Tax=Cyclobacterium plantarum TaxID=2716263 RepID=A0ABX0H8P0_9BACT|nr:L-arabinose isomerase [Cyclobacterium plantarum]NHE56748.1 L-arabinose isomerase [Cyclobacterium plantarum]
MKSFPEYEVWFITGSQHLYGEETLNTVALHAKEIAAALHASEKIAVNIVYKPIVTSAVAIYEVLAQANGKDNCIGVITWMHTFSPAKMWINGLKVLQKPLLHLHTQYNRNLPWDTIDMDFMNLNQSAHGDREFGFICTRMEIPRKVVVGHWKELQVQVEIDNWCRAACGWSDWQGAQFVRFGDNMRQVAVTEGNKVSAEMQFGFSVNTHGVGDLVSQIAEISSAAVDRLIETYEQQYLVDEQMKKQGSRRESLRDAARIELGLKQFLEQGSFKGFTNTFEDLHGMKQLPGIAVQRLMAQGYGYAGEGDWKTMALVRAMKVMGKGLPGGNAFMEDYTYDLEEQGGLVLGAHMLEVDESLAAGPVRCEIHPLDIGGKDDPVRLVFNAGGGHALNASLIDLGAKFRLVLNEVEAIMPPRDLPELPVARCMWRPKPDFKTAATAWILAGGAHHTGFSQNLPTEVMEDFAEMAGLECLLIDGDTRIREFKAFLKRF